VLLLAPRRSAPHGRRRDKRRWSRMAVIVTGC
jgi:hypothetical protein